MTMIIQRGTLKPGAILIVGDQFTKVKYMHDDKGNSLSQGIPGDAVQIVGIPIVPKAG
jgi:translation initiation factor IF-2